MNSKSLSSPFKKVLVGGCFDLLHIGHIVFLEKAKALGDFLIILLESDSNIKKIKGEGRPYFNQKERKKTLLSFKCVDQVVVLPSKVTDKTYNDYVKKIKPSIIVTTQGDPILPKKKLQAKSINAKIVVIKKYKTHSSTLIEKSFL